MVITAMALTLASLGLHGQKPVGKLNMKKYDGIDVSHHQGEIDWKEVARDKRIQFVYIKATQGTTIRDDRYRSNIRGARRHGLKCGSYHYLSSMSPVRAQFNRFKAVVKKRQQDLIPMVDVEKEGVKGWSGRQLRDSLRLFCRLLKDHYGKSPLIYSHFNFYNEQLAPWFNNYFLFFSGNTVGPRQASKASADTIYGNTPNGARYGASRVG